jgi:hypothetical protein
MNDPQIREMLSNTFLKKYKSNDHCLILEEVGVMHGSAIVDLAVFSKVYNQAFEIKSADDSLSRLPIQLKHYIQVFDYITVITQPSHLEEVNLICPKFVGILVVYNDWDMEYVQKPTANGLVLAKKLIQVLWRDEVYKFLKSKGFKGLSSASNAKIKKIATDNFSLNEIRQLVFETLKTRPNWKTGLNINNPE